MEISEATWMDVLDEYAPTDDGLKAEMREFLTLSQQHVLRQIRDRLPVQQRPPEEE